MLKTRQEIEQQEAVNLASYAMKSKDSQGRLFEELEDNVRTCFQKDRNKVIYSKSFRRLQAKTQVLVSYYGDHYRDRMTHSIEVSQIARDMSRTLGLNEDLSECLALAHDLGHPPFGHGGEDALNEMMQKFQMHFEHNEQSRRILEKLEKIYPAFDGLNVTREVLDGLLKHNPHQYQTYLTFEISPHLEGQIVDLADEIAYTNHDIDDGIRSGFITVDELRKFSLWSEAENEVSEQFGDQLKDQKNEEIGRRLRYRIISKMVGLMIMDAQKTTDFYLQKNNIQTIEDVRKCKVKLVQLSVGMQKKLRELRGFLMNNFYLHPDVRVYIEKGKNIICELFEYYLKNPNKLPSIAIPKISNGERLEIMIKDYIAGMTDNFAEETWEGLQ